MEEKLTPKFISNVPIGDDLFEGKSQEKIAEVISKIILNNDFQIIGIDGAWGTGKSNLVGIIEKKLANYNFFIYDVWGHQEDEQRKSILVELTEYISCNDKKLVPNRVKWKDKLKMLLSREREITTINKPYLSLGIVLILFSVIYTPTVRVIWKDLNNFYMKIGLIFLPLIIFFLLYVVKLICKLKKGYKLQSFSFALQEMIQIYNNKQVDETKTETISENEPSVRDFRNWLHEIDKDLNDKKLVLVFDNFDRLPKKHILSIWSSIHIFFAEEKYKNIKVIIPFDRLHIKNAFKDLNAVVEKEEEREGDYANDYINKTFDLVYRVSQPILSDWKEFFKGKWEEAFSSINEEEFLKVIQVYETFREKITPREIIACINEIVSIKLLDDSIPDRYIAIFVLNKDEILKSPLKAISESNFLRGLSYLYQNNDDFQKYITALVYQIKADDALEIVYKKQLKESLFNAREDDFKRISRISIFDKIIDSVIQELANSNNYDNLIITFDKIVIDDAKITDVHLRNIWNNIYFKLKNNFHDGFAINEYQKILCNKVDIIKAKEWVEGILKKLFYHDNFEIIKFSALIDDLQNYFDSKKIEINLFENLSNENAKKIETSVFLEFVKLKKDRYKNYAVSVEEDKLDGYLVGLDIEEFKKSDFLQFIKDDFRLEEFKKEINKKIETKHDDVDSVSILIKVLKIISERPFEFKFSDAVIYNLYNKTNINQDFYYDLLCLRLSRLKEFNSSYSSYFQSDLDSEDDSLAEKIAERIEYYIDFDDFLIGSKHFSDSPLYKNIAKKLILNIEGDNRFNLTNLLVNYEDICSNIKIEPKDFINKLDTLKDEDVKPEDIITFPLVLFSDIKNIDCELKKLLFKLANQYFENFNVNNWKDVFNDFKRYKFELLLIIEFNNWESLSFEAFKAVLTNKIEDKLFDNENIWKELLISFTDSGINIENTLKDLRDIIYSNSTLITPELFTFLIEPFIENDIFKDNPKEVFRTFFKTEFLNNKTLLGLMLKHYSHIKDLLSIVSKESSDNFKQALRDKKDSNSDVSELAKFLDIRSVKRKED